MTEFTMKCNKCGCKLEPLCESYVDLGIKRLEAHCYDCGILWSLLAPLDEEVPSE